MPTAIYKTDQVRNSENIKTKLICTGPILRVTGTAGKGRQARLPFKLTLSVFRCRRVFLEKTYLADAADAWAVARQFAAASTSSATGLNALQRSEKPGARSRFTTRSPVGA
jgi:hypothetical protein